MNRFPVFLSFNRRANSKNGYPAGLIVRFCNLNILRAYFLFLKIILKGVAPGRKTAFFSVATKKKIRPICVLMGEN